MTAILSNGQFWLLVACTLAFAGVVAACGWFGTKTALRLDALSPVTPAVKALRDYRSWAAVAMLLFAACIVATIAQLILLAFLLALPYTYVSAVGIYREGRA